VEFTFWYGICHILICLRCLNNKQENLLTSFKNNNNTKIIYYVRWMETICFEVKCTSKLTVLIVDKLYDAIILLITANCAAQSIPQFIPPYILFIYMRSIWMTWGQHFTCWRNVIELPSAHGAARYHTHLLILITFLYICRLYSREL
jgi:hypothetical protein